MDTIAIYMKSLKGGTPRPSVEEEAALARQRDAGDVSARNRLVESILPLAVSEARKFMGRGTDLEDLIQEANRIVIHVADVFDPERGTRITTLAMHSLWRGLQRFLPQTIAKDNAAARAIRDKFSSSDAALDSVRARTQEEDDDPRAEHREMLAKELDRLDDRSRAVIERRLAGDTLQIISKALGISRERVRQIEQRAIFAMGGGGRSGEGPRPRKQTPKPRKERNTLRERKRLYWSRIVEAVG